MSEPRTGSRAGQRAARLRQQANDPLPEAEARPDASPRRPPATDDSGRNASVVGAGILLSRLSGLVREMVTARFLGVGLASDAFKAALRIPNLLQNLLGEGVLSASFIPVYARLVDTDEEEAGRTAGAVAGLLAAAVSVLVVVGMVAARPITIVLTPGFRDDPEKLDLTVSLVRIMFPGIGLLVLSAWCLAILNSHRRFFLSYVAPVLWNVAQIVVVAVVAIGGSTPISLANALAWGVVLGGLAQLLVQLPTVRTLVPDLRLSLDRTLTGVRDAMSRLGPVVFGRGVVQISGYLDLVLASLLVTGAVTAGTYAQVLYLLPVSLFGMSIAASELPELSRMRPEQRAELAGRVEGGLRRVAYFVAPTAVIYIALGEPLVAAVFQGGEFSVSDTRLVWLVLAAYSLGLLASTGSRLLQNSLYALDDPRTPARIALVRVVTSSLIALSVMFLFDRLVLVGTSIQLETDATDTAAFLHLGAVGIALGSAVGAWVELALLRLALRWRIGPVRLGGGSLATVVTAALAGAAVGRLVDLVVGDLPAILAAGASIGAAGLVYLAFAQARGLPVRAMLGR
ncbi:MAG TPA: murein biosynthesis integral membrane protein MurJ [Acidimicrobiales bacterium]|nr:murein biosynthesis integral membrane protein MurJ [Acidimicrobiales bacterium]